jgi:hypothetical protein
MSNPFFYGNPVSHDQLIDRRRELRRIVGRIVNQGQSTAVVGEPRSGKTSLLLYLSAPETRDALYGPAGKQLFFSFLDSQALGGDCNQARFWKLALQLFYEEVIRPAAEPVSPLAQAYQTCQENSFGTFTLEKLLAQVNATGWRLVLLLDEFDVLLHHPQLSCAEFFGGLRTLATRSRGALALVIASRRSLTDLNRDTQQYSRTGSPYFNFLDEITLGPLPDKYVTELLRRADDRFTSADRRFVVGVAAGHPYLLQAAASELWEAHAEGQDDPRERWQQAGQSLYDRAAMILDDIWRIWSPAARKAFTIVALADVSEMLEQRRFFELPLTRDRRDVGRELRALAKQGFISEDRTAPVGWRVRPRAFLWWLADEMVRTVRDATPFEAWLQDQELELLLTRGERKKLGQAVREVADLLKDGATTLIEAAAKGAIKTAGG